MSRHILMHQFLQIEPEGAAIGADDDIRAHTPLRRDIASGIVQPDIGRIVEGGDADLFPGGIDQSDAPIRLVRLLLRHGGRHRQAHKTELQCGSTGKCAHAKPPGLVGSGQFFRANTPFSCSAGLSPS